MTTKPKQNLVHINDLRCKGCDFCVEFCPQHIIYQSLETNPKGYQVVRVTDMDQCTGCDNCARVCPEFAIWVETPDNKL
ncbi:MAG: 4Fe-4S binding protein [Dehalococcoidia bacterium]|nr:4Fe-4S binding protein [Dehalococcoidia bacterium]